MELSQPGGSMLLLWVFAGETHPLVLQLPPQNPGLGGREGQGGSGRDLHCLHQVWEDQASGTMGQQRGDQTGEGLSTGGGGRNPTKAGPLPTPQYGGGGCRAGHHRTWIISD